MRLQEPPKAEQQATTGAGLGLRGLDFTAARDSSATARIMAWTRRLSAPVGGALRAISSSIVGFIMRSSFALRWAFN